VNCSLPHHENEHQRIVNDSWSCILGNLGGDRLQKVINKVLATFIAKTESGMLPAPSWKWVSTEHQQFLVMYLGYSVGWLVAHSHKQSIGCLYRQTRKWNAPCPILKLSVNGVSMIVGLPLWSITARCGCYCLYTWFWLFLYAKRLKNT